MRGEGRRQDLGDCVWKSCPSSCLCHFSLGLAVVFVAACSACQRSAVTGGYFNKLLQFLEPCCIALASLFTTNGACVAGCGPREAAELAWGWGEGAGGGGAGSAPPSAGGRPGTKGWPHPGRRVPGLEVLLASTLSELSFFFFLFIAPQARVYGWGGKLPLALVRSINKKRNRTRKRESVRA